MEVEVSVYLFIYTREISAQEKEISYGHELCKTSKVLRLTYLKEQADLARRNLRGLSQSMKA